jgi:hypothetical protein
MELLKFRKREGGREKMFYRLPRQSPAQLLKGDLNDIVVIEQQGRNFVNAVP